MCGEVDSRTQRLMDCNRVRKEEGEKKWNGKRAGQTDDRLSCSALAPCNLLVCWSEPKNSQIFLFAFCMACTHRNSRNPNFQAAFPFSTVTCQPPQKSRSNTLNLLRKQGQPQVADGGARQQHTPSTTILIQKRGIIATNTSVDMFQWVRTSRAGLSVTNIFQMRARA